MIPDSSGLQVLRSLWGVQVQHTGMQQQHSGKIPRTAILRGWKTIWGPGLEFNMKHDMPHALRPPGQHSQGETIPNHSNDSHKLKPQTKTVLVLPHYKEGLQIFRSTHCLFFLPAFGSDQHHNPPEHQPRKTCKQS